MTVAITLHTYKGADWLEHVSIPSILNQVYQDWELFIVSDGEGPMPIFDDKRIHYSWTHRNYCGEENNSIGSNFWNIAGVPAINECLSQIKWQSATNFDYIAHIDQDDYWLPNHLHSLVQGLELNPDVPLAYTNTEWHFQDRVNGLLGGAFDRNKLFRGNYIAHSSICYRPDVEHDYYYSMNDSEPSDYQHLKSFFKNGDVEFLNVPNKTVLYFQRCSLEYAKSVIKNVA